MSSGVTIPRRYPGRYRLSVPLPPIATARLDLVPFDRGDVDAYHNVWGDPEVIWWGHSPSREDSAAGLNKLMSRIEAMPEGLGWAWLVERSTGEFVGDVVLEPAPNPPGGIETGWHLARRHWGKGFATEGAVALLQHAWSLGLDEVIATIVPVNLPSVHVAERLGMVRRGPTVPRGGLAHGIWVATREISDVRSGYSS